jgi:RHS repeat-associated protein
VDRLPRRARNRDHGSHRIFGPKEWNCVPLYNGIRYSVNAEQDPNSEYAFTSKTRLSDSQQWTFTWDYRNRLTQAVVKTSGGATVANDVFTYDVEDQRIGKSTNGTQTWTFYKDHNPYADFNGSGTLVYRYLYGKGLDQLLARADGTAPKWYLTDNIGSVRLFVTTAGSILDQLSYDSYGNILTETGSANGDRFKYTARDWDSEIGLQYNRARYYDPKAGRWISLDPLAFRGNDPNLYRYIKNLPADGTDPSGMAGPGGQLLAQPQNPKQEPPPTFFKLPPWLDGLIGDEPIWNANGLKVSNQGIVYKGPVFGLPELSADAEFLPRNKFKVNLIADQFLGNIGGSGGYTQGQGLTADLTADIAGLRVKVEKQPHVPVLIEGKTPPFEIGCGGMGILYFHVNIPNKGQNVPFGVYFGYER